LKEAGLFSLIDVVLALAASLLFRISLFDVLGLILLLEGAVIMLVGGALGFAGQPGIVALSKLTSGVFGRRKESDPEGARNKADPHSEIEAAKLNDVRAAFYMLVGFLLFLESMALAYVIR
jgi:hypothetical protein